MTKGTGLRTFNAYPKYKKQIRGIKVTEEELSKFKIGRNEPCPCNSGLKHKKCCIDN